MNQRLKGLLLLPASRKIIVMLIASLLLALEKKLGLELPSEAKLAIVTLACAVIFGIAYEDGQKMRANADLTAAEKLNSDHVQSEVEFQLAELERKKKKEGES